MVVVTGAVTGERRNGLFSRDGISHGGFLGTRRKLLLVLDLVHSIIPKFIPEFIRAIKSALAAFPQSLRKL